MPNRPYENNRRFLLLCERAITLRACACVSVACAKDSFGTHRSNVVPASMVGRASRDLRTHDPNTHAVGALASVSVALPLGGPLPARTPPRDAPVCGSRVSFVGRTLALGMLASY